MRVGSQFSEPSAVLRFIGTSHRPHSTTAPLPSQTMVAVLAWHHTNYTFTILEAHGAGQACRHSSHRVRMEALLLRRTTLFLDHLSQPHYPKTPRIPPAHTGQSVLVSYEVCEALCDAFNQCRDVMTQKHCSSAVATICIDNVVIICEIPLMAIVGWVNLLFTYQK